MNRIFIHVGGERVIRAAQMIAIFDISIEHASRASKQFMDVAGDDKKIEVIGEESAKSIIVTDHKIYYSPISSATLKKRAHGFVQ